MKFFLPIAYVITFLVSIANISPAQGVSPRNGRIAVVATTSSNHLVTAEITYVTYAFTGLRNYPEPTGVELKEAYMFYSHASSERINGKNIYYLHYTYQAVKKGTYEIPAVTFRSEAGDIRAGKLTMNVYPKDALSKKTTDIEGQALTYYTLIKSTKSSLFPNETTHVEHKIYLPQQLNIALWGLPLGDKKNCTAWRFKTPKRRAQMSRARIDGKTYQAGNFHTNLTSLKEGKASIGPLKSRVVFHAAVMTNRGLVNDQFEVQLLSDKLNFTVKPLPLGQPEHYQGDVGNYAMAASIDTPRTISENDSIQIIAQLKGTGNLATVNPPLLLDMDGWKIISESRTDLGDNRKSAKGIAEFTYLIQPDLSKNPPTQTPSLFFVALDPDTGKYDSSRIPGKPITIVANDSAFTESGSNADTRMQKPFDGLITTPQIGAYRLPWYRNLPIWLIYILPLCFISIVGWRQLRRHLRTRRLSHTERNLKRKALADLEKVDSHFLKSAGAYIERWIETEDHASAREILSLRDSLCFRPESRQDVSAERRRKIIAALRKCSLLLLFACLLQDIHAKPEKQQQQGLTSFEEKDFSSAIRAFANIQNSSLNPDILYNIGLCNQLNNEPARAAYHYHLALKIDKNHASSLKNLSYVETENGSITRAKFTDLERWVQALRPETYLHIIAFLVSIILCLILTFIYLKPRATAFRITIILCIFAPFILSVSIYGYLYHPDRSTCQLQSALVTETTNLTSQPLDSSEIVLEVPPASRCHLIAQRGSYSYVIMANGIKGWITSDQLTVY